MPWSFLPPLPDEAALLTEAVLRPYFDSLYAKREEIVQAFLAEHGCLPSACEQVIEHTRAGLRWYIRRRVC